MPFLLLRLRLLNSCAYLTASQDSCAGVHRKDRAMPLRAKELPLRLLRTGGAVGLSATVAASAHVLLQKFGLEIWGCWQAARCLAFWNPNSWGSKYVNNTCVRSLKYVGITYFWLL